MIDESARVAQHTTIQGGYRCLALDAPRIAQAARPGQFVHLLIPRLDDRLLRRPFSIHRAEHGRIMLLYKAVGVGTRRMTELVSGEAVSLVGPLGRGFPLATENEFPVLVAGGYGMAPLYLLAQHLSAAGLVFAGGADRSDILCVDEFTAINWTVRVATENGTMGVKGLVTVPLDEWLSDLDAETLCRTVFYGCGPHGMLRAVADRAGARGCRAWISLDRHMGCGVGACLACVQKIRSEDGTVRWGRVCRDGPVFDSREIVWDE